MGFNLKNASEILKSAVSYITHTTNKLTDFTVGSVTRTLLEAVALQIEEFYFKVYDGFMDAVENSVFNAFSFERLSEEYATGDLTVEFRSALTSELKFTAGITFCTSSSIASVKYYSLTTDIIAPTGATKVILPVKSTVAGVLGNTTENSISIMVTSNSIVSKVYNEIAFTNGRAAETKAERKSRFKKYISTLVRGTIDSIEYAASTVTGITGVYVDDSFGLIRVYCHDANGDLSNSLKTAVKTAVDQYRAAGVEAVVLPVIKQLVNVEIKAYLNQDYNPELYKATISTAVYTYLYEYKVNQAFYKTSLIKYLKDLDELAIIDIDIISPSDKISASNQVLLRPGTITVHTETITS